MRSATCSHCLLRACWSVPTCSARSAGSTPRCDFYGDDLDLCWRAHLGGARVVVVVPAARARHREASSERRPDLRHGLAAGPTPHARRSPR